MDARRTAVGVADVDEVNATNMAGRCLLSDAAVPLLMYLGIEIGAILAGAAVTETVFARPGLGRLLVESVAVRDLPVVQAAILVSTFIMVVSNLTFDIFHAVLDPRVGAREWSAS
jgi:peptide/nickel transport system permease protein